jgi:5-methylcytosine-specific restriction endonuclease McrA
LGEEYNARERERGKGRVEERRAYNSTRKERNAELQRGYRQRHPDKANARWERWHAANPDKRTAGHLLREQRLRAQGNPITGEQWLAIKRAYDFRCAYCGKKPQTLTQDHVDAVSRGGLDTPSNIVPACKSCNGAKGNRPPPTLPATRLML